MTLTDCRQCGAKVDPDFPDDPEGWFCDHCGVYFDNTLNSCPICGAKVNTHEGFARKADGHQWQHDPDDESAIPDPWDTHAEARGER